MWMRDASFGLLLLLLSTVVAACAAGEHAYPRDFSTRPIPPLGVVPAVMTEQPRPPAGVTGVWQGVSHADCIDVTIGNPGRCGATQNIILTMMQQGDTVSGFYKCAYGTEVCRNLNESGVIRNGQMTSGRLWMRVMLEDGSMCFFTGRPLQGVIEGRYSCLQGGGVVERGAFRTQLHY